jgi:hypothetical protein
MVNHWRQECYPSGVSPEEFHALLKERLATLDAATTHVSLLGPIPVQWRAGWRGILTTLGRDRDGSLLAKITCMGPGLEKPYVRKVRLTKEQPLTLEKR